MLYKDKITARYAWGKKSWKREYINTYKAANNTYDAPNSHNPDTE